MICPHCGADTPAIRARCTGCGQSVASAQPTVATSVLTPPPTPPAGLPPVDDTTGYPDLRAGHAPVPGVAGFDVTNFNTGSPMGIDAATYLPDAPKPTAATGPLAIGQKFGPRYQIIRLLGIGGMGAVYQAWDSELDVVVALKVIRPEATSDPREARAIERRFKQELLLARQVTHKNVVRIHDLGEIDDIKYITMSYIEGADLATVLKKSGKLPVPAALKIMRQVASGLLAAHEAGVVHRDLKPANIMVEGETAVIMDFGIARSATASRGAVTAGTGAPGGFQQAKHAPQETIAGTIVGTIAYMAPEQARGEAVDQRADLYALGLIVSDMLLGPRLRGSRKSAIEELQRRMTESQRRLRSVDPQIPEALEQIVARCVETDPAARFHTTAELVAALDRLDENGEPLPLVRRLTPRMMAATAVLVLAMLAGTYFVTRRALEPPKQHDPVAVLIADFQNNTGDAAFDRTLEPMLRRALEGAGFISAFDRTRIVGTVGVRPPERLDEVAARELAVNQGLGVVLAGSIDRQGSGFGISLKAVQTVTGNVIATAQSRASTKDDVLPAATRLVATVRKALGDETSESDQIFAMTSLSATSLDVVRHYAAAMDATSNNKFEEARQSFLNALELDPQFGVAYQGLAGVSRNLGRLQDAEKYANEALRYLTTMTERERYSTRGFYHRLTGDYQQCVKEYGELITRYTADVVGRNQLALCQSKLRDLRSAVENMQLVVNLLPNRALFRGNLALYAGYAGDFQTAETEARAGGGLDVPTTLALAFAQVGQGQFPRAIETYQKLGKMKRLGASFAVSGLADVALIEGRFSDAVRILAEGAAQDLASKDSDRAATKFATLAHIELQRDRKRTALDAIENALANSNAPNVRFLAARSLIEAGESARARPLINGLASELQAEPQAYAKILEGEIALKNGDARQAIKLLSEANGLLDTWLGHFVLGRAYLEAGGFTQADSEFDRCIKRRGEALSVLLDEEPTFGYFPAVYYYQGRVREALKNAGFAESYKAYLTFRGESKEDPLVAEARRRAGN
jgi:tetratricopeptide (TPR) repeat protein